MDNILLIDAHNAIWRACVKFGSAQPEAPDEVIFTYNFFRNLRPIVEDFKPDKCFFVLEGHPQFRYDLFADYKANRIIKQASKSKSSERFFKTRDIIIPLLQYLPITICRAANYEADDVIATLCENMKDEDLTILSNDSDYIQLLQKNYNNIRVYNPIKKEDMIAPDYPYVAWKCLAGDKSDNIPNLLKPKSRSAEKAEQMLSNPSEFEKFLSIEENRSLFQINRQLIEFRHVPEEEISIKEGSKQFPLLKQAFADMKFESIINQSSWEKYTKTFNCLKF